MTWVIKAGSPKDGPYDGEPEYLHSWPSPFETDPDRKHPVWTVKQSLAFRFDDRNQAAKMCASFPICAYSDDVRLVKLAAHTKGPAK